MVLLLLLLTHTLLADYYVAMSIIAIAIDTTNCRCCFLQNVIRVIAERDRERVAVVVEAWVAGRRACVQSSFVGPPATFPYAHYSSSYAAFAGYVLDPSLLVIGRYSPPLCMRVFPSHYFCPEFLLSLEHLSCLGLLVGSSVFHIFSDSVRKFHHLSETRKQACLYWARKPASRRRSRKREGGWGGRVDCKRRVFDPLSQIFCGKTKEKGSLWSTETSKAGAESAKTVEEDIDTDTDTETQTQTQNPEGRERFLTRREMLGSKERRRKSGM